MHCEIAHRNYSPRLMARQILFAVAHTHSSKLNTVIHKFTFNIHTNILIHMYI